MGGAVRYAHDPGLLVRVSRLGLGLQREEADASGRYVQLQPSEWMYASIASSSFCLAWPVGTVSSLSRRAVEADVKGPASDGIDWQLGTPFLKKVYSVFR